jgi:transcriptional regulator with XRE-family HTH domain
MDDVAIGRLLRSIRVRLRLRQVDVATRAGISQQLVSVVELGALEHVSIPALRRLGRAVGAEIVIGVRWRGAEIDRLRDEDHAQVAGAVVRLLESDGWLVRSEVTYNEYGERGSIDILAFHPETRTLLVIEVKSELVSVEETLRRLDQKTRLAPTIARTQFGWTATRASPLLALLDTRTCRRRVARHDAVLGRAFSLRGLRAKAWLRAPSGPAGLLLYVSLSTADGAVRRPVGVRRVVRRRAAPVERSSRSTDHSA